MSRSGYTDDCENLEMWRGAVRRAIRGKRGQAFLREMLDAMDAMPVKRLISDQLADHGEVCAIGVVGAKRGIDMSKIDPDEPKQVADVFGIARALAAEIEYINDEAAFKSETPEERWARVREWIVEQLPAATVSI